ncbi:hypothetical protein BGZ52_013029 [Haplosporangium bisporale]|nr:hypothetical protein BGZ52_013029 [Haplosporangium bisporale]
MLSREPHSARRDHTIVRNGITSGTSTSKVEGAKGDFLDPKSSSHARREQPPRPSSSDMYTHASRNHPQHRPTDGIFAEQITSPSSSSTPRAIKSQNRIQSEMDPYDFKLQQHLQRNGIAHKSLSSHRKQHENDGQDRSSRPRSKESLREEDHYRYETSKRQERRQGGELASSTKHQPSASEGGDHRNKSLQRSTCGDMLTIRDILDSREIRNHIDEQRRSTNSNPYASPSSPSWKHGDVNVKSKAGQPESMARTKGHRDDSTRDFSIDQSMLEKKFRAKLDAVVDDQERRDRADIYPYPRSPATQRRQRDLYHSSYSPSDFSETGEDNDDDDGERTVELKPGQVGIVSSTPVQVQAPLLIQTDLVPPSKAKRSKKRSKDTNTAPTIRPEDTGYDSAEISWEREVAIARAKRELGASINGPGPSSVPASLRQQPERPTSSKLDHGRDLVLEDLVSPTSYKFGGQGGTHNLITRPAPPTLTAGLPMPSAAPLPLNNTGAGLTRVETQNRFMEMAGSLGEGQAVGSVLWTFKGMIRDLKSETKKSNATIKLLQKDLKKTKRELEKTNKSKERLSKALPTSSNASSSRKSGDNRRGSVPEDSEQERIHAGIRREQDQVEKNLVMLQKRIAAQEQQMADMHARDKVRAQQEADLKLLMDTESEEEVEDESEDEDEDDEEREHRGAYNNDHHRNGESADEYFESTKQRRKSTKDDGAGVLRSSFTGKRSSKPTRAPAKRDKARQAPLDSRRDKVEEVHIHHHVHYSDEEEEGYHDTRPRHTEPYSTIRSNSRYNYPPDDHRPAHFAPRQSYRASLGTLQIPVRDIMSRSYPGQRSRYPLYEDDEQQHYRAPPHRFRRSQGHPITRGFTSNNRAHDSEEEEFRPHKEVGAWKSVATAAQQTDTATSTSTQTELETPVAQPPQSPQRRQQPSGTVIPVTTPLAPKAPQKKLSIDIQRILSLLKTHDPTRCTVCSQGGDPLHQQHSGLRLDGRPIVVVRRKNPIAPEATSSSNPTSRETEPRHRPSRMGMARSTATTVQDFMDESENLQLESEVESFLSSLDTNILDETQDRLNKERGRRDGEAEEQGKGEEEEDNNDDDDNDDNEKVAPIKPHDMKGKERKRSKEKQEQSQSYDENTPSMAHDDTENNNNEDKDSDLPEQRLHEALQLLEEEVRELRASYLDLTEDLEVLTLETELIHKRQQISEAKQSTNSSGSHQAAVDSNSDLDSLNRKKKQIQEQLRKVFDCLEEKADLVMVLQEQALQEQHKQQA